MLEANLSMVGLERGRGQFKSVRRIDECNNIAGKKLRKRSCFRTLGSNTLFLSYFMTIIENICLSRLYQSMAIRPEVYLKGL